MSTSGKAVVRSSGKRAVLSSGKAGVFNGGGTCVEGCGSPAPCYNNYTPPATMRVTLSGGYVPESTVQAYVEPYWGFGWEWCKIGVSSLTGYNGQFDLPLYGTPGTICRWRDDFSISGTGQLWSGEGDSGTPPTVWDLADTFSLTTMTVGLNISDSGGGVFVATISVSLYGAGGNYTWAGSGLAPTGVISDPPVSSSGESVSAASYVAPWLQASGLPVSQPNFVNVVYFTGGSIAPV